MRLVRLMGLSRMPPVAIWKKAMIAISAIRMPYSLRLLRRKRSTPWVAGSDEVPAVASAIARSLRSDDCGHDLLLRRLWRRHLADDATAVHDVEPVGDA